MRWFTVHHALRQHGKWLSLDDHGKAAWLSLMLIGSTGTPRWCVGDRATAVELLRREGIRTPGKALDALISALLVDVDDHGALWMHDAEQWQRKPSDEPDRVLERVQRHRAAKRDGGSGPPVTPRNAPSRPVTHTDRHTDRHTPPPPEEARAHAHEAAADDAEAAVVLRYQERYGRLPNDAGLAWLRSLEEDAGPDRALAAFDGEHAKDANPRSLIGRIAAGLKAGDAMRDAERRYGRAEAAS